jgi:hypothetical protein
MVRLNTQSINNSTATRELAYKTRFHNNGMGKLDLSTQLGVVRRVQSGKMEVSGTTGDVTFTVWITPFKNPSATHRVVFGALLAELAMASIKVGMKVEFAGNLMPASAKDPAGWMKGTVLNIVPQEAITGVEEVR